MSDVQIVYNFVMLMILVCLGVGLYAGVKLKKFGIKKDVDYVYFVSYLTEQRAGNFQVSRNKKIESIEEIGDIEDEFSKKITFNGSLIVTNFILLREVKRDDNKS